MRILFVHNSMRSFVRMDRDILASVHEVDELDLSVRSRIASLPVRLAQADLVFNWFASLHSFFPSVLAAAGRKPVVSVVGAYDAANVPEIRFGHMGHPVKRHVVRAICGVSSLLICNSEYAADTVRQNVRTRTPIRVLHHGVHFPPEPAENDREAVVLSVGQVKRANLARKGHEVFVHAAAALPEVSFILVGEILDASGDYLRSIAPPNFELRDHIPQDKLDALYRRASVYVQASVHESFGLAVVEAMGAGEIPVVSRRGALPEVVREHGIFIDENDPASVAAGVTKALAAPVERRRSAAAYVRQTFPLSKRREGLLEAVVSVS